MRMLVLIGCLFLMINTPVNACDEHGKTGIVPENDLWIGPNDKGINTITEEEFNEILDRVIEIYAPIVEAEGANLVIERKWDDGTVNAYAMRDGSDWKISMFGGLARHETITKDGFALVACHELGHHIGGPPKKGGWMGSSWASNEGQSDYFGTAKCLRKFMEGANNVALMKNVKVDPFATNKCRESFTTGEDLAMCQRGSMAGMSLANLFSALRRNTVKVRFDTPDPKEVGTTYDGHPDPQCRLDTYFGGAVCEKDHYIDFTNDLAQDREAACTRVENYSNGIRPLCWYKPTTI